MKEFWRKLRFLRRQAEFEVELDEEIRHHLALKAEETGDAAAAKRAFGNVTRLKEDSRGAWVWTFWDQLAQDIRYGVRSMRANLLFTCVAVVSLALGIGANTAIYSFVNSVLLRQLPVPNAGRLVVLMWRSRPNPAVVYGHDGSAYDVDGWMDGRPQLPCSGGSLIGRSA